MITARYALALLLAAFISPACAYNYPEHEAFAGAAAAAACPDGDASAFCLSLRANLPFLVHGAKMEDEAAKGYREIFNGVEFRDDEPDSAYGPCRSYVVAGANYMYCNHYFFLESYRSGGPEGSCGRSILGATTPECDEENSFRWESARQRGLRLWKEKVLPSYYGGRPDSAARAYYWLGRVAHLLADTAVPAHLIPHKIGYVEFEHRSFEYEAGRVPMGALPAVQLPGTVDGLFTGLAGDTLAAHDAVRAAACRRSPLVAGCDRHRASPSRPLQSAIGLRNIKLTNDLMSGKRSAVSRPEIIQERALAAEQLKIIKPLTAVYTAALLELFAAEAALLPRDMAPVPAPAEMPAREVSFDYVPR